MRFERLWSTGRTVFDWPLEFSLNICVFFREGAAGAQHRLASRTDSQTPRPFAFPSCFLKKAAGLSGAHCIGPSCASARHGTHRSYQHFGQRGWFRCVRFAVIAALFSRSERCRGVSHFVERQIAVCCGCLSNPRRRGAQLQAPDRTAIPRSDKWHSHDRTAKVLEEGGRGKRKQKRRSSGSTSKLKRASFFVFKSGI